MRQSDYVIRRMAMLGVLWAVTSFAADRVVSVAPPRGASATAELLETGWKASSQRYAQAQEIYQRARQAAPGDVRVPYAMSLVAMRNSKLDEAAKYIDEAPPAKKPIFQSPCGILYRRAAERQRRSKKRSAQIGGNPGSR